MGVRGDMGGWFNDKLAGARAAVSVSPTPVAPTPLNPRQQVSAPARDLLKQLLERNPAKRTRAAEALRHPWLMVRHGGSAAGLAARAAAGAHSQHRPRPTHPLTHTPRHTPAVAAGR